MTDQERVGVTQAHRDMAHEIAVAWDAGRYDEAGAIVAAITPAQPMSASGVEAIERVAKAMRCEWLKRSADKPDDFFEAMATVSITALSVPTAPAQSEAWCPTCGSASPDGLDCLKCSRWWAANPPPALAQSDDQVKALEEAAIVVEVVQLARRDIARTQTDFLGRMGEALCMYEAVFDEFPDGDLPDNVRQDADENVVALASLALAQLAMLRHPADPLAALAPVHTPDTAQGGEAGR